MKNWYESKTLWFNVIMMIVMAAPVICAQVKVIEPAWAVLADSIAALITGIGNAILRVWFTDTPIDNAKMRATWKVSDGDELSNRLDQAAGK